jgi:hypothetical protein
MDPGYQLVDAGCRPEVDKLCQRVGEPGVWVHRIEFACLDQRSDDRPIGPTFIAASKKCVLAIKGNRTVILPISGRMSSCIIAGIRCRGRAHVAFRASGVHWGNLCTSS